MGQQEVYTFLKRHSNKWLSSKEIAKKLKASSGSVITSLKKLREGNIVSSKFGRIPSEHCSKRMVYIYRFRK